MNRKSAIGEFIQIASAEKESSKATMIEAMENASKKNPGIINVKAFQFVIKSLADEAPRVKWESAKVISNTAHLFPKMLNAAIMNLLNNSEHQGSVVRWSAATAMSKIIELNLPLNKNLLPAIEKIAINEKDNAVKKIYLKALKETGL